MSLPRVAEKIVKLRNGEGTITTNLAGNEVVLTALAGTYPLKLVPARHSNQLACVSSRL